MGNVLFRRKKVVAEELEELQKRGEALEAQIRSSLNTKQSIQWFSGLSLFFLTVVAIAFSFINVSDKGRRTAYSAFSVFAGFFLLYCFRRITNEYYTWSIQKKLNAREEVAKKKRELLEKVKETETFKVAKEILEKYDDAPPVPDPTHKPRKSRGSLTPNQTESSPDTSFSSVTDRKEKLSDTTYEIEKEVRTTGEVKQPIESKMQIGSQPVHVLSPKPPRPFFKPSRTVAEKVVDFIIGDTPSDRFALICSHCYGHNGMARKEEFDFLSFRCWICGEFNPARRQRKKLDLMHTQSEENLSSGSRVMTIPNEGGATELRERRNRLKTRSSSHQRPLTTSSNVEEDKQSEDVLIKETSSSS